MLHKFSKSFGFTDSSQTWRSRVVYHHLAALNANQTQQAVGRQKTGKSSLSWKLSKLVLNWYSYLEEAYSVGLTWYNQNLVTRSNTGLTVLLTSKSDRQKVPDEHFQSISIRDFWIFNSKSVWTRI